MSRWAEKNKHVIAEFRANAGKVAEFGDMPLVILHTIGARTGQTREIPLMVHIDGDAMTVFASAAGSPNDPDWAHNLRAHSRITVEFGADQFVAEVTELEEDQRAARLDAMAVDAPRFAQFAEQAAPRLIPAFSITRV